MRQPRRLVFLLLFLLVPLVFAGARPAAAADLAADLALLNSGDYGQVVKGIQDLGASAQARAVPILKALASDQLMATASNRVVIAVGTEDNPTYTDALTGAPVTLADSDQPNQIVVNDQQRSLIQAALGSLTLASPNPADRLAAARDAFAQPAASAVPALKQALATEQDRKVKAALTQALAAAELLGTDKAARLQAVDTLAASSDPEVRQLLGAAADTDTDPSVQAAAKAAIAKIDRVTKLIGIGVSLFEGLSLGSILLLAAIGLAITFGAMGVINMAHGEMIMLGAYTTYVVQQVFIACLPPAWLDFYLVAALPAAFLVAGAVGVLLERSIIRFLYGRPLETLLATWGISLALQQAVRMIFGAPNKAVANPSWMTGGFDIGGGYIITWNRLIIIVFAFVVLGALSLIMRRTSLGLHIRAVTQNRRMAASMGIPTDRIDAMTFGLGSGIAGIAGVALSQIGNVSPNLGTIYIIDSFMVVVFGGVGNMAGTLAGAMSLGVVNKLLEPFAGAVLGKIIVLVAIIVFIQYRPRGLFALKGRSVES
jgi:urea transport system permease protein